MGFLTRLLAGLLAASTLGTGLAGTANAVDVTGAAGTTKSVVKLADDGGNETSEDTADNPDDDSTDADSTTDAGAQSDAGQQAEIQSSTSQDKATAKSSLPDHIVNGSFDYPACPDGKNSCDVDPTTGWGGFYVDYGRKFMPIPDWDRSKFGWDSSQEGLRPDQQPNSHQKLQHCVQIGNKPNNNGQKMNRFAEIIAETPDEYIYQDIATTPGVMYRWSLKHASEDASHVDSMQVMIGSPGRETAQDATRTTSNGRGDRTGVTSKTIATKGGQAEWETYTGVYVATSTVTRFTFKSAQGRDSTRGNFIDDVMFTKAYKLTYDKNSADASGQVPSNQRGKENTTQPAKNKTNGKIRLASDTSKLSDHLVNSDFEYLPDGGWKTINARYDMASAYTSVDPNNGQYIRNTRHADSDTGTAWVDWDGFDASKFAWRTDQKGGQDQGGLKDRANAVELQQDSTDGNTYAEMVASETGRTIYQDLKTIPGTLYKIRLKHASLCKDNVDKMQVVINGTPIEMTRVTANGKAGDKVGEKSTTIATKVTNENRWHHSDQWETYEGYYVIPDGQTTTRFGFKAVNYLDPTKGNLLDDVTFARAYKLSYDKNSTDATGEVPSNQRGKENTTQSAKTKTNGTVKTVADENVRYGSLVNGDFSYPSFSDIQKNEQETHADLRTFLKSDDGTLWYNMSATDLSKYGKIGQIPGFDSSRFAWSSTENGSRVELQQDRNTKNTYAEIVAQQDNTSIYQNVSTGNGGVLYKIRLKHASRQSSHADRMQVLVGADAAHATPVEMTRVTSNGHGDKVGGKSTIITTKVSNTDPRDHGAQWETYEGTYLVPEGQKNTVFMFKSLEGFKEVETLSGNNVGNLVDDIEFSRAYRLTYDKNSGDASGSVPSDTAANTVKQAKTKTNGSVKLVADDDVVEYAANGLPKQLVNSDFDHDWRNIVGQSKMTGKYNFANVDPAHGDVEISGALNSKGEASKHWVHLNGFDAARFGWKSNQTDTRVDGRGGIVEIQRSKANDNMYAEITASQANTYLYQDIDTAHSVPTVYTVKLRYAHRNGSIGSNEKIQVLVGAPGHEQPVTMTRIASRNNNRIGEKSTTVNAPNTDGWLGSWDTFQGSVEIPAGQPVSRFTFKALGSIDGVTGNLIDDVQFKLAYPLSYDKNAQDATGSVPSSQYGKENTVQPAKAKTTGSVRLAADKTASGLTVHDLEMNDIPADYRQFILNTTDTRLSQVEFEDGAWYKSTDPSSQGMWPLRIGASLTIPSVGDWTDPSGKTYQISMTMRLKDWNGGSVSELYRFDGHGNIVGDGRFWINTAYGSGYSSLPAKVKAAMGGVDTSKRVGCSWTVEFTYADTGEKVPDMFKGVTGFNDLDGWDAQSDLKFEGVQLLSGFDGAYKRSDAELGTYGTNGFAGIGHDAGDEAHLNAPQQSRHRLAATWTGSTFTFSYDLSNPAGRTDGSRMTFGAPVTRTAVLTYDKNAADASGQVPSNTTPDTTQTASSKSTGKVSDLVQRTTTHEDGSVTVRTIDTSTDVVSGCQVYYPAGQKITLATMAKDDDCWDASMLSRPGHTQLGWNQDRNATQAQAQVTMVEGGMTVYAVWVGNPVLTYDTNKPSTWSGQMPSTPASVSVPYNTAAADGSGWRAGDTTKIRGYKFLGWYTTPQDGSNLYDWNTPLTGSVTVYAHWQRLQANVIYNANGGTGSHPNTTGWQYSDVTIPGDTSKSFTRDGYVFKGWSLKAGKADVVYKDGSQIPLQDKDITLYAQWQGIHENFTETGGISLPLLIAGGIGLLVMGVGSTVMLTRRMNGHGMPDGE
ncbi:InlB B-repeat-containing protein [Bifidobacterium adolescentis]|uniref:InlB B-repeat-containing protein n=1 Tax=Bifidobacterium adolescentis TaxID=1680 RepID=UPI0022E0123A|nr:InlB B-repeat-containing protein [Bifidobacterium adolescentis]